MIDRESLIDELFAEAVVLKEPEREAFFAEMSAKNGAVHQDAIAEVMKLLQDYKSAEADGFLKHPLTPGLTNGAAHTLAEGQDFAGYRILKLIDEGGMGEVYLGHDRELDRKVAIKIIRSNLKTRELLRRFRNERQIMAGLRHANIAKLFQAGASADGLPFFVMEYVEGSPIDRYINEKNLSTIQRLNLFCKLCSAVSCAHQNLVIHRDIKPSNVLVTDDGEPKLLDFGIAKLLDQVDTNGQNATVTLLMAMTPEYASPEQVKGDPITTATDVYSLGVLLYELLTGRRPYNFNNCSVDEIAKVICEAQPERPSHTAARSRRDTAESKKDTHQDARELKSLKGDLDNIVLKALRKEPERRYSSVEQFAEDIQRHLDGLPVRARSDTFGYRASKFIRRNKIAFGATVLVILSLAIGVTVATIQARRANRRFNEVRQLAHSVLFDYHDAIAALPGSTAARQRLVNDGLQYLDNLSNETGNDVSLLSELATAYEKVAAVQGGTVTTSRGKILSESNLGDTPGAMASLRKAISIRGRLVALEPNNRDLRYQLANAYQELAGLHLLAGPAEKAIEYSDKTLGILEPACAADPNNADLRYVLGSTYLTKAKALGNPGTANLGDIKGALEYMNKARAIAEKLVEDHPNDISYQQGLGVVYNLTGSLMAANGDSRQGLDYDLRAAAVDERLVDLDPENTMLRNELAVQTGNIGSEMMKLGDTPGALLKFQQALSIYEKLVAADPNDAAIRRNAGVGYRNVGVAIGSTNRDDASKNFHKALEIFADLASKNPSNADFRRQWAYTHLAMSRFQSKVDDLKAAVGSANEGIRIEAAVVTDFPTNASAQSTLAYLYIQLGDSHSKLASGNGISTAKRTEQCQAADSAYRKSLEIFLDMKTKGTLSAADAGKPDEIPGKIAKCTGNPK